MIWPNDVSSILLFPPPYYLIPHPILIPPSSLFLIPPSSLFPLPLSRPGGMCGAIESAALAVWQDLACRIESKRHIIRSHLADLRPPHILPPAASRIPRG